MRATICLSALVVTASVSSFGALALPMNEDSTHKGPSAVRSSGSSDVTPSVWTTHASIPLLPHPTTLHIEGYEEAKKWSEKFKEHSDDVDDFRNQTESKRTEERSHPLSEYQSLDPSFVHPSPKMKGRLTSLSGKRKEVPCDPHTLLLLHERKMDRTLTDIRHLCGDDCIDGSERQSIFCVQYVADKQPFPIGPQDSIPCIP
ncbi:hypothetical protein FA10DRAFT_257427 [Acaromyces ingoldii]|uniref:Uncharacterized protein n=1 Tax=Acaromyces ingoldii TaxID=215250 RepID=A0A316YTZ7_9BASI|nr:hypothetical protein FA10DRAFT_257427 [Acaromyces ingoldii]PWN93050.1 hypothetical protein FA10DRAFT_257427 [Acaromyces ingoldii]